MSKTKVEPKGELDFLLDEVYRCNAENLALIQMTTRGPLSAGQLRVMEINKDALPRLKARIDELGSRQP
ncbi:MAG: hypothetical protein WAZ50_01075 [Minisyncoccia bacterium]